MKLFFCLQIVLKALYKNEIRGRLEMKEPKGADLLSTLITLLAEQEGVKINYQLEGSKENGKAV